MLARSALPQNVGAVIQRQLSSMSGGYYDWQSVDALRHLFKPGARWEKASHNRIAVVRRQLLQLSDDSFIELTKLLARDDCLL